MSQKEITDLELFHRIGKETEKAILVHDGTVVSTHEVEKALTGVDTKLKDYWLAKSQIEYEIGKEVIPGTGIHHITVTLPVWLAEEKGLI